MKPCPEYGYLRPDVAQSVLRHPAYPELRRRYLYARRMWRDNPGVQEAAKTFGMSENEYCNAIVASHGPILWTSTTANAGGIEWEHYHLAYMLAEWGSEI